MLKSIVDSDEGNRSDGDLRAQGKIRLEDAEAQKIINELVKEFEEYGKKSKEVKKEEISENEEQRDSFDVEKDVKLAGIIEEAQPDSTLTEKLLRLFREFCERFIERDVSEARVKTIYSTEKRRKKLMVEALLNMLKRLSRSNKEKNLIDLLDEQIENLQKALETEQDPLAREAMQERLDALLQLRMDLARMNNMNPSAKLSTLLLQCALAEGYINMPSRKFQGVVSERAMYLSRGMGKIMDVGDIEYRGIRGEMGSMAASYCVHLPAVFDRGAASNNSGISAITRSFSILDGIGISKADRMLIAGRTVGNARLRGGLQLENILLATLMRAVDNLIDNVINRITKVVANVIQDIRQIGSQVWTVNITARDGVRSTAPRQERETRSNSSSRRDGNTQEKSSYYPLRTETASAEHVRSHLQCKIDGDRVERTEYRETRGVSFVDVDYGAYFVRSVVCTYHSMVEKISSYLGNSPSSQLSAISVERVQQNQVVMQTQVTSR
ncbi:hypothetical protein [Anaplasma bovis]|uniref:hypothetical protein n=1 Tax=Anaplasma bovis TaxID=186733 RepID=UPI002FF35F68